VAPVPDDFVASAARHQELLAEADRYIAGGTLNILKLAGGRRLVVDRAERARILDVDGTEYLDFLLSSGPMVIGHSHPEVVEAVRDQMSRGSSFYALTEPTIGLAADLVEASSCAEKVRFCSTGSEATMFAMRIARAATGRDLVLKFEGGFHGSNDYALMSMAPSEYLDYPSAVVDSKGIPGVLQSEVLVAPFNDPQAARFLIDQHADRLAAVIVEPMQRALKPLPGFLDHLRVETNRHGVALIFDEVVTGFRLAYGGAQEKYGVTPDLATYGKILGGGFPLAAVAGTEAMMSVLEDGTYMSGTLSGNPISSVAGRATLQVLRREGTYGHLDRLGERARTGLEEVLRGAGFAARVIGDGPVFQIVFRAHPPVDYREFKEAEESQGRGLAAHLLEDGLLFTGKKGYISTAHTDEDIDRLLASVKEWAEATDARAI
jgi:glutamate-1-semialdehyde 2,1-aminomutase